MQIDYYVIDLIVKKVFCYNDNRIKLVKQKIFLTTQKQIDSTD